MKYQTVIGRWRVVAVRAPSKRQNGQTVRLRFDFNNFCNLLPNKLCVRDGQKADRE